MCYTILYSDIISYYYIISSKGQCNITQNETALADGNPGHIYLTRGSLLPRSSVLAMPWVRAAASTCSVSSPKATLRQEGLESSARSRFAASGHWPAGSQRTLTRSMSSALSSVQKAIRVVGACQKGASSLQSATASRGASFGWRYLPN